MSTYAFNFSMSDKSASGHCIWEGKLQHDSRVNEQVAHRKLRIVVLQLLLSKWQCAGPAEEGRQHEGKMATAYLAGSKAPGSLVHGFSLEEKEAVSALTALQQ